MHFGVFMSYKLMEWHRFVTYLLNYFLVIRGFTFMIHKLLEKKVCTLELACNGMAPFCNIFIE